jgi:DNA-binding transcriptional regulator YiaG
MKCNDTLSLLALPTTLKTRKKPMKSTNELGFSCGMTAAELRTYMAQHQIKNYELAAALNKSLPTIANWRKLGTPAYVPKMLGELYGHIPVATRQIKLADAVEFADSQKYHKRFTVRMDVALDMQRFRIKPNELAALISSMGISRTEFAGAMGVSNRMLAYWLSGRVACPKNLRTAIGTAFGPPWLLQGVDLATWRPNTPLPGRAPDPIPEIPPIITQPLPLDPPDPMGGTLWQEEDD